jgi:hypothetical protein
MWNYCSATIQKMYTCNTELPTLACLLSKCSEHPILLNHCTYLNHLPSSHFGTKCWNVRNINICSVMSKLDWGEALQLQNVYYKQAYLTKYFRNKCTKTTKLHWHKRVIYSSTQKPHEAWKLITDTCPHNILSWSFTMKVISDAE